MINFVLNNPDQEVDLSINGQIKTFKLFKEASGDVTLAIINKETKEVSSKIVKLRVDGTFSRYRGIKPEEGIRLDSEGRIVRES